MEDHVNEMLKNINEEVNSIVESHEKLKLANSIIYYVDNLQKLLSSEDKIKNQINNLFKEKFFVFSKHFDVHPMKIKLLYCFHNLEITNHDELFHLRNKIGKILLENKDFFIIDYYKFVFTNNERTHPYFETFVYYLDEVKDMNELYNKKKDLKYIITIATSFAIQSSEGLVSSKFPL